MGKGVLMSLSGKRANLDIPQKSTSKKSRPSRKTMESLVFSLMQSMNKEKGKEMKLAKGGLTRKDVTKMSDKEIIAFLMKHSPESLGYDPDKKAKGGMPDYSKKKAHQMNMGGMMEEKKINPSTGMAMKKGGMVDYRKGGMFYGGGMAKARSRGK